MCRGGLQVGCVIPYRCPNRRLGVSGAPGGDNDALCAKAGLDKIRDRLKLRHVFWPARAAAG
jgi:hypothetical protein